jgi:hypothetical protein
VLGRLGTPRLRGEVEERAGRGLAARRRGSPVLGRLGTPRLRRVGSSLVGRPTVGVSRARSAGAPRLRRVGSSLRAPQSPAARVTARARAKPTGLDAPPARPSRPPRGRPTTAGLRGGDHDRRTDEADDDGEDEVGGRAITAAGGEHAAPRLGKRASDASGGVQEVDGARSERLERASDAVALVEPTGSERGVPRWAACRLIALHRPGPREARQSASRGGGGVMLCNRRLGGAADK